LSQLANKKEEKGNQKSSTLFSRFGNNYGKNGASEEAPSGLFYFLAAAAFLSASAHR
jgi:hypothetical protein